MKKIRNTVFNYLTIIIMALLMAFNYQLLVVVNNYAPAGLNGIATMIQYKTGFSIGYFSLIINIPLCLIACFTLNRKYALRTLCYTVCYSVFYIVIGKMNIYGLQYNAHGQNIIFPVLLSGVISGFVYGMLFSISSSTGGTDIIAKFLSVKKPELNFFWVTFTINLLVAVSSFFVYAQPDENGNLIFDYLPVCLCVVYCFVSSYVADYFLKGTKKACEFTIITSHAEELTEKIHKELKHSCTKIPATGGYSGETKDMLLCVVNKQQISDFNRILSEFDNTFAFAEIVTETYGNFKRIR